MSISDKTRKLIWVKTGNRCAICRQKLVIEQTSVDLESVIGDECHIISQSEGGPRFDRSYPKEKVDAEENLIVLCKSHHKMIDDQVETYTAEVLRAIKQNHEKWVETQLSQTEEIKPVRIVRRKDLIPKKLPRVSTGKKLFDLSCSCGAVYHDFPDDLNSDETEIVGAFLQDVMEWSDLSDQLEPIDRVRATKSISDDLEELHKSGFVVFAATEKQTLEGGIGASSTWYALHLVVLRDTDPRIMLEDQNQG